MLLSNAETEIFFSKMVLNYVQDVLKWTTLVLHRKSFEGANYYFLKYITSTNFATVLSKSELSVCVAVAMST